MVPTMSTDGPNRDRPRSSRRGLHLLRRGPVARRSLQRPDVRGALVRAPQGPRPPRMGAVLDVWATTHHRGVLERERQHAMTAAAEAKKMAQDAANDLHPNLAAALVAALSDLTVIAAARTANVGSYSYSYADIGDVVKLTRPVLAAHGLVALTPVHDHGDGLACTVIVLHASGERMDLGPFPFPHGRDAQATGSMVTYHRRYALVAALGMAAGDDDDGASAKPRQRPTVRPFDLEAFLALCAEKMLDPYDVLAHAEIDKPLDELNVDDRPALSASLKVLLAGEA